MGCAKMGIKHRALPSGFRRDVITRVFSVITENREMLKIRFPNLTNEALEDIAFNSINAAMEGIKEQLILNTFRETGNPDRRFDFDLSISKLNDEGVFIELASASQKKIILPDIAIGVLSVKKFPCMEQLTGHWVLNRILYDTLSEIPYDFENSLKINPLTIKKEFETATRGKYLITFEIKCAGNEGL